eukprot:GHVR01126164.1.p1 GENE.GHVR01126164.1~~GHVR01126164.1.p1  ORF type:complete len:112 (+),score=10.42 GHVR01126164.1:114-449(+)
MFRCKCAQKTAEKVEDESNRVDVSNGPGNHYRPSKSKAPYKIKVFQPPEQGAAAKEIPNACRVEVPRNSTGGVQRHDSDHARSSVSDSRRARVRNELKKEAVKPPTESVMI